MHRKGEERQSHLPDSPSGDCEPHQEPLCNRPCSAAGEGARIRFGFKILCWARLKTCPLQTAELHAPRHISSTNPLPGTLSSPEGHETHLGLSSGDRYAGSCVTSICPLEGGREAAGGWALSVTPSALTTFPGWRSTPGGIPGESRQEKEALGGRAGEISFPKREDSEQEPT